MNFQFRTFFIATLVFFLSLPSSARFGANTWAQAPKPTSEEKITEAIYLNQDGWNELTNFQFATALAKFQQALAIFKEYGAKAGEASSLNNIGTVYSYQGNYLQALQFFGQALSIYKQTGNRENLSSTLDNIGEAYANLYQYQKALEYYQQALTIYKEKRDANNTSYANILQRIASVHFRLGQYAQALQYYQQILVVYDRGITKAQVLNNIGVVYANLGKYGEAIKSYQQSLQITTEIGNCYGSTSGSKLCFYGDEAAILNNLGAAYFNIGQYEKALELAQKATDIYTKISQNENKSEAAKDVKLLYTALGQNSQSLENHQQALAFRQQVGDNFNQGSFYSVGEALNLNNLAEIYYVQGKYDQVLKLYQKALAIYKANQDKSGEAIALNSTGRVYNSMGQFGQALQFNQQALALYQEIGDRTGEGVARSNIAQVYAQQKQLDKAQKYYQQALAIHREVADKVSEATTLAQIGYLLEQQPELAIVFYKQSVNVTEEIRQNLRGLPKEQQLSFTSTVTNRYRRLASLLLQQNRPTEAQQVIDLLKIQEINDYLGQYEPQTPKTTVTTNINTRSGTISQVKSKTQVERKTFLLPQEQQFNQKYAAIEDKAIQLGKELTELRKIPPEMRSPQQKQRILELDKIQQQLNIQFNEFINSPFVASLIKQINKTANQQNLNLAYLNNLRDNLQRLQQNAVLLYPLILEDRVELVLLTPYSPPIHRTVAVKKKQLNSAILAFRTDLQKTYGEAKKSGSKLYNLLIKPIENDLKQADAKTIIYAPDGQLRYIPLAALYDGNQWLIQRFRINHITTASLTDFNTKPQEKLRILAAAFTQGNYNFKVGEQNFEFAGLPFAGKEVDSLAAAIPNTTKLIDRAFSRAATVPQMNDYNIVHLATHAAFVKGLPESSFILFGDGDRVTLRDISTWSLPNVDLVILSACQTALGDISSQNGEEILGLGYQLQKTGAKAAIASLWSVSDGGTQALMNTFYSALKKGNVSKAEALQQAQIALITNKSENEQSFNHPYYWAPFILIGNGL